MNGGAGVDRLEGGAGDDVYIVDDAADTVVEAVGAGTDQVQASASYVLSENIENLFLTGSASIDGSGNALDNYIAGNAGSNVLRGMGGNDTMVAGAGNDTLIGGTGDDTSSTTPAAETMAFSSPTESLVSA
jgi:Ca2+-binding RTX toxin-like protein